MYGHGVLNPNSFNLAEAIRGPVYKCKLFILFLNILLTVFGGILAGAGYNGCIEKAWGHVGLTLLCTGSLILTIVYAYITIRRDYDSGPVYQIIRNADVPSSESEQHESVAPTPSPKDDDSQFQDSEEPPALDHYPGEDEGSDTLPTRELLSEVANILATNPPESPKFEKSGSESTLQSKSSLYTSAEMVENESEAAIAEKKPLLPKKDI